ncbi:MAG: TetR/AcrR family transcriptional regulator [Micropepsaceae bacterium]
MSNVKNQAKPPSRQARARRPRNSAATRRALVDAAAQIFNGPGYFATDTNAIARTAGYAPASFYKHFDDKTSVLLAVYEDYVVEEWNGLRETMAGGGSVRARLQRALSFIVEFHGAWTSFRTGIRAVARIEPTVAEALRHSRARQLDLLADATGLSPTRNRAALLLTLSIVERLADTVLEGEASTPAIPRSVMLAQAERALLPLLVGAK